MPPHKAAALLYQAQHYRAIPEFVGFQRRPFPRTGKRVTNIRECQGRQILAGGLQPSHLRRFLLTPSCIMETGRQFKSPTARSPHRRTSVPCKGLKQSGPLQHRCGLLKEIHRYLKKCLTPESTNSNEPSDRDARHRSTDLARTPSTSDSGGNEISVIRRGISTLVCLDKAQVRRYYRLR